jgi:hypothetical protein
MCTDCGEAGMMRWAALGLVTISTQNWGGQVTSADYGRALPVVAEGNRNE